MTRIVTIQIALIALAVAAWTLPIARAINLLSYALNVDDGSIHTANDIRFGTSLVVSYCFSLAVTLAFAWFLPRSRTWLLVLPLAASFIVAADVIRLRPENVIVIFPTMHPFRPAIFSLLIAGAGALIIWFQRRHERVTHIAA